MCFLPLCIELKLLGVLTTATVKADSIAGCPLKCEIDLKKEGRGSICYRSDANFGIVLGRWMDFVKPHFPALKNMADIWK